MMEDITTQLEMVLRYHEETKHRFDRYARAPGYLDWANQPDPFRRYRGAALVRLPVLGPDEDPLSPPYDRLFFPGAVPSAPVTSFCRASSRHFAGRYSLNIFGSSKICPSASMTG